MTPATARDNVLPRAVTDRAYNVAAMHAEVRGNNELYVPIAQATGTHSLLIIHKLTYDSNTLATFRW